MCHEQTSLSFAEHAIPLLAEGECFELHKGGVLHELVVRYTISGTPQQDGSNVILLIHALTGDSHACDPNGNGWWQPLFESGCPFDPRVNAVICANLLGSCYGTTGPASRNPATGEEYGDAFPAVTIADLAAVQIMLLKRLAYRRIHAVVGCSIGGMVALECIVQEPAFFDKAVIVAAPPAHTAWGIAWNEIARMIFDVGGNNMGDALRCMEIARALAMISYRSQDSFEARFGRTRPSAKDIERCHSSPAMNAPEYAVGTYLRYQGLKLAQRFHPVSYRRLIDAMDSHDIYRSSYSMDDINNRISLPLLMLGVSSDVLYQSEKLRFFAESLPNATNATIDSPHGHDAFLIEFDQVNEVIANFLQYP